jgi:hypothetical protein
MNIRRIANLNAGGEIAHRTALSTYLSYPDTIRTQILNWSLSCGNCKFGTTFQFLPSQKPTVLSLVRVTTSQDIACRVFGWVWNWTEPIFLSKPELQTGYLDAFLTLSIIDAPLILMLTWGMVHVDCYWANEHRQYFVYTEQRVSNFLVT